MIASLQGKVQVLKDNFIVVDVHGVGYKIFVTQYALGKVAGQEEVFLFTHTYVREDMLQLYGFVEHSELEMFELLISVSGIGPKAALGILSIADPKTIQSAVMQNDSSILTRVSGVGKKTAERVILELQNKIQNIHIEGGTDMTGDSDTIEALMAMGYSAKEARTTCKEIPEDIQDMGERVKYALKHMNT